MKYIKLNMQLLLAFVLVLGLFSCTDEDAVDNGKKEIKEGLPTTVSLKLTSATPMVVETKAEDSNGKFGVINDLAILVYKDDTKALDKVTIYSKLTDGYEWAGKFNATTGKRRVYVLANYGLSEEKIKSTFATENDLLGSFKNKISAMTIPVGNEKMIGFVQKSGYNWEADFETVVSETIEIPESSDGATPVISLSSRLYPPYSKITFTVRNEVKTDMSEKVQLNITNVYVRNLPTKYSLLPETRLLGVEDVNLSLDGKPLEGENDVYTFYMYENMQGDYENQYPDNDNRAPYVKNPGLAYEKGDENLADWNNKWGVKTPCTYIEVEGSYAIWKSAEKLGAGEIHYRFFLGNNTTTNFDIRRNTHYNVELAFNGTAGYNELEYEWRVYADLTDAIIIPEGELAIDGACDAKFPFYVINTTGGKLRFTLLENIEWSDLQFDYKDVKGFEQKGHSKPELDLLPKKEEQGLYEFKVYPVNIGVIGSPGHSSYWAAASYDHYKYNGEGKEVGDGKTSDIKLNYTLRDDVLAGKIFRKRTVSVSGSANKTLIIREYPLLFLGDKEDDCDINGVNAIYAQRIDMGFVLSQANAQQICPGKKGDAPDVGIYLHYTLPTKGNLDKINSFDAKDAFPLKSNQQYWTSEGLWSPDGSVDPNKGGYVRCVYRSL